MTPIKFGPAALAAVALLTACGSDASGPAVSGRKVAFQRPPSPPAPPRPRPPWRARK